MIAFLSAYFFDSIGAVLCTQWVANLLFFCFVYFQVTDSEFDYTPKRFYLPLMLLLLQDFAQSGRFGFALIWLIPLVGGIWFLKRVVLCTSILAPFLVTAFGIFLDAGTSSLILNGQWPLIFVTFSKIWYTWMCGMILILGLRGNRCWLT